MLEGLIDLIVEGNLKELYYRQDVEDILIADRSNDTADFDRHTDFNRLGGTSAASLLLILCILRRISSLLLFPVD